MKEPTSFICDKIARLTLTQEGKSGTLPKGVTSIHKFVRPPLWDGMKRKIILVERNWDSE